MALPTELNYPLVQKNVPNQNPTQDDLILAVQELQRAVKLLQEALVTTHSMVDSLEARVAVLEGA